MVSTYEFVCGGERKYLVHCSNKGKKDKQGYLIEYTWERQISSNGRVGEGLSKKVTEPGGMWAMAARQENRCQGRGSEETRGGRGCVVPEI